jgi:hypothetical protein
LVPPSASRIFIILAGAKSEVSRGSTSRTGRLATSSPSFWWWKPSSSSAEEASSSHAREGELLLPARMQHSVRCPRFRGEDGSKDLPVRFGVARARRCGVGGQADAAVGADVVAAGESFSAVKAVSAAYGPTSGSLALMSGSRPLSGDANESLPVARPSWDHGCCCRGRWRVARKLVAPQAPRCGGCSYPRERNRSSVCNGTLSVGVCSLWLSGPEHVCIFGTKPCFFLISSTRTRLSAN